jgi:hypothetical protein
MRKLAILAVELVAALLVAMYFGQPGIAQDRKEDKQRPPTRMKWEYKVISGDALFDLAKDDKDWRKLQDKLQEGNLNADEYAARLLEFMLNKLGDDGWELTGYSPKERERWVFKRVK